MAVNRTYSLDRRRQRPSSDPEADPKTKANYPNTVAPLLGGGTLPGYQAGSTFKMFPMLAALDAGHAAVHRVQLAAAYRSNTTGRRPSAAAGARPTPAER